MKMKGEETLVHPFSIQGGVYLACTLCVRRAGLKEKSDACTCRVICVSIMAYGINAVIGTHVVYRGCLDGWPWGLLERH
jgi:hypothetical protein